MPHHLETYEPHQDHHARDPKLRPSAAQEISVGNDLAMECLFRADEDLGSPFLLAYLWLQRSWWVQNVAEDIPHTSLCVYDMGLCWYIHFMPSAISRMDWRQSSERVYRSSLLRHLHGCRFDPRFGHSSTSDASRVEAPNGKAAEVAGNSSFYVWILVRLDSF